jgi:hypothetical protein
MVRAAKLLLFGCVVVVMVANNNICRSINKEDSTRVESHRQSFRDLKDNFGSRIRKQWGSTHHTRRVSAAPFSF